MNSCQLTCKIQTLAELRKANKPHKCATNDLQNVMSRSFSSSKYTQWRLKTLTIKARLYESKEGADFTLICESREIMVHSFLLKPRSKFFAAACDGPFQAGYPSRTRNLLPLLMKSLGIRDEANSLTRRWLGVGGSYGVLLLLDELPRHKLFVRFRRPLHLSLAQECPSAYSSRQVRDMAPSNNSNAQVYAQHGFGIPWSWKCKRQFGRPN